MKLNFIKSRTAIGLICIVLSLFICFILTPMFNSGLKAQTEIIRISSDMKKGEVIAGNKLEVVKVGAYNLPQNIIKRKEDVVGKYVNCDLMKGDYILSSKVTDKPLLEFEYLNDLDGTKVAMSITIKSFAAGLSGKLESGDIVTLISSNYDNMGSATIPSELKYVKVLAATTESGMDKQQAQAEIKKEDKETELPSTLTLIVNTEQAKVLADLEQKGNIHATLVYRGSGENAKKFLNDQDNYFKGKSTENTIKQTK
ncbi:Flp pilus assembly protein CpaB [Acetivibrio cellulolyticus]|uniref:Flp pilus assembly protein CpaB n=1 Tax=Acetivibrio cellulolyticus TaxID=35830 RepID=UPI0001E2C765|nr:RcpC/CpaB family pilus assembly protein [Acetivibrio cellulolyticus]